MKNKKEKSPKRISQKSLVRMFKDIKRLESDDNRFCFLIGAGASKSSGIPTGWELSKIWYENLKEDLNKEELKKWEEEVEFDIKNKLSEYLKEIVDNEQKYHITIFNSSGELLSSVGLSRSPFNSYT